MEHEGRLKDHLEQLERNLLHPTVRSSPEKLDKLLADDFFEYGSSGIIFFKKDCVVAEGIKLFEMEMINFEIHHLAPTIVLATYQIQDKTRDQNTLRSSIWKYIDGEWQLFFHQGTLTSK